MVIGARCGSKRRRIFNAQKYAKGLRNLSRYCKETVATFRVNRLVYKITYFPRQA